MQLFEVFSADQREQVKEGKVALCPTSTWQLIISCISLQNGQQRHIPVSAQAGIIE